MKDIRYTEKKVDSSWKEQIERDRRIETGKSEPAKGRPGVGAHAKETSKVFLNFLNSLAFQILMHLGEVQPPPGMPAEVNLDGAKEIIDLLIHLKEKTEGNLSAQETTFFESVLPELQMKYVSRSS